MKPKNAAFCSALLMLLALRLLTPAGYMPASAGSGLLFELCPDGLPAALIDAIAGGNHHHHHGGDESTSAQAADKCPLGHMLSASAAVDEPVVTPWLPAPASFQNVPIRSQRLATRTQYLSRAPPA